MRRLEGHSGFRWLASRAAFLYLWLPILGISLAHYSTVGSLVWLHDVLRRFYYIPIVLGAFLFGLEGSMVAAVLASLLYVPHAFAHVFHQDPALSLEKVLEIVLYNVVGFITGKLADQQFRTARDLEQKISEMKDLERQLVRAGKLQALGELTAGLAHEIRNPLASLKTSAAIVADEIQESSPRRKMVVILQKELERLDALLSRFLSFARPGELSLRPLSLPEVVDHTLQLLAPELERRRVGVEWVRPERVPSFDGDGDEISQVVLNVVLNAIQVSPEGGVVVVRCTATERNRASFVCLEVEDQGPGVPDAIREKIFEPFFSGRENGVGLGLSIATRIMDEHHGYIEVDGAGEQGARFLLYFPVSPPQSGPASREPGSRGPSVTPAG